jgi:hypothetical protein
MIINFLSQYWVDILIIVAFITVLIGLYRTGNKKAINRIILFLVVKAEKFLGSGTGELKFNMVYQNLPRIVRCVFTAKELKQMIDGRVEDLRHYLETSGATLDGYDSKSNSLSPQELDSILDEKYKGGN